MRFIGPGLVAITSLTAACAVPEPTDGTPGACTSPTSYGIDTGASVTYTPGVDAGFYAAYVAGGHWHFEWTCDTKLSAYGCNFSGTVVADTPAGGTQASCYECEPAQDSLSVVVGATSTAMSFDTVTSTGVDGLDFFSVPGHSVNVDLYVNGIYQADLVYLPSGGTTAAPRCLPFDLVPSTP